MNRLVDAADLPEAARSRLRFSLMQWLEAAAPSNFLATNPEAQQLLIQTQGQSLGNGLRNLLGDLQKGRLSQSDESRFQVGRDLGITPGPQVFQNPLIHVITYVPPTAQFLKNTML